MKWIVSILLIVLGGILFVSCHYSKVAEERERVVAVRSFDRISVQGGFSVSLEQGNENGLIIRGLNESLETTIVENDTLEGWLRVSREKLSLNSPHLVIRVKELREIVVEGGAKIMSEGYLDLKELQVSVEGGAKVDLKAKAEVIKLTGEGGVVFDLEGVCSKLTANLYGAAYLDAEALNTDTAQINLQGVGYARIDVNDLLDAHVEGVGKVRYTGSPKVLKHIEGLGKISKE